MQDTTMSAEPRPLNQDGGGVGDDCFQDGDCATNTCVFDPPSPGQPGRCACNPTTQEGCEGDFVCASPGDIGQAVGELISVSPFCKLPVGTPCQEANDCLTNVCNGGICRCNTFTNFPCSIGEICALDSSDTLVCLIPDGNGNGALGSDCLDDSECESGTCYFGFIPPGTPGTCTCNPSTNAGCDGDFVCYSSEDLQDIQSVFDASNECLLPFGALCDGRADIGGSCVTGNCAETTGQCTCNELTNFPCDTEAGEACLLDTNDDYSCGPSTPGPQSICPEPAEGSICTFEYVPVLCPGECEYSNQCVATSSDPTFTPETCELVNQECPEPDTGTVCTTDFLPVLCPGECEYSNQCVATSADPTFTPETCDLVEQECPESTGICTQEFAPVNCSGCEYSNQCIATDANPGFNSTTCTPVTNP